MPVTGYAFYLNAEPDQVLQVFSYLFVPFSICKPVKLGVFNGIVPVKYQAQVITEVCCIDKKVDFLWWPDTKNRRFRKIGMKVTLQGSFWIATLMTKTSYGSSADNPIFKPDKTIGRRYCFICCRRKNRAIFAFITLLIFSLSPFY